MGLKKSDLIESWFAILLGVLAVIAIKSIFENDNSKIISKKGRKILLDSDKMKEINRKIIASEDKNHHQEIFI